MKRMGMVVAVEIDAALCEFGKPIQEIQIANFTICEYEMNHDVLYVGHSGAGQIAAAMMTQLLITKFNIDLLINFGVVGGLSEEMTLARTCIVESVVHYDFDTSAVDDCEVGRYLNYPSIYIPTTKSIVEKAVSIEPTLKKVICASGDKFIADKEKRCV